MNTPIIRPLTPNFILEQAKLGNTRGSFEAASLFVDVSGFTPMMDAAMLHGVHGSEVLADVMRSAFTPLLEAIFAHSGFVATHAGDSFMALFPLNPETANIHQQRALTAAYSIQQTVAQQQRYSTSFGDFQISVKIGLGEGQVEWGILTAPQNLHNLVYFRGSAVDACARAEHAAQPGQIILQPEIYQHLQAVCQVAPHNGLYQVTQITHQLLSAVPPNPLPTFTPDLQIALRFASPELLHANKAGEFRQVTHLFVGIADSLAQEHLETFGETLFKLQTRYGGHLELLFGDKGAHLLAIWGAPVAYENDTQRAAQFCLELNQQYPGLLRCSLTRRIAHTGYIGCALTEQYAAYGRGVNLAARFMTAAPAGHIWADEAIAQHLNHQFEFEDLGEQTFKGFSASQKVYRLHQAIDNAAQSFFHGRMVGRERELATLHNFCQRIFEPRFAGMLVVWGEPGIGKSRLVHHFLENFSSASRAPIRVFITQSDEILRLPFNPFRYWLRAYFGQSSGQSLSEKEQQFESIFAALLHHITDPALAARLRETRPAFLALLGLNTPDSNWDAIDAQVRHELIQTALECLLTAESQRAPLIFLLQPRNRQATKALKPKDKFYWDCTTSLQAGTMKGAHGYSTAYTAPAPPVA